MNNQWLVTTELVYESEKIPASFDGFRIVQISDLHDATFGENQEHLVEKVRAAKPDAIFLTGDLVDSRRYDLPNSLLAVEQFVDIADVYYVLGNHEVALNKVDEIYATLTELGVHVLSNEAVVIERDGERIATLGIEDPLMGQTVSASIDEAFQRIDRNLFTILLSHRPEQFEVYVEKGIDLVFTGHAHGGQIRVPTYTAGTFEKSNTNMIVSRGLGNSLFPLRIFNLPEIILIELKKK